MKTKRREYTRVLLAIILSVFMVSSCIVIGSITTANATTWHDDWRDTDSNSKATIYFDNSITKWDKVCFKIGRNWNYGSDGKGYSIYEMSLVNGTDYIYKKTIDWGKYNDFYFCNGGTEGWHSDSSVRNHDSQYTAFTTPKSFALGSSTYFFIGQNSTVGTTASPNEVTCFGASGNSGDTTASHYTTYRKSITNTSVSNGNVVVTYKNDSGTNQTISEGSTATNILIGKTLTVTETPNANYSAGDITVTYAGNSSSVTIANGGSTFTSGNTNTVVTGSFHKTETMYTVNVATNTGGTLSSTSSLSAGANTSASLPTVTPSYGYKFDKWVASSTGITITNATSTSGASIKATSPGTVTATYTPDDSLNLYVGGRFKIRTSASSGFTYSFGTNSNWDDGSAEKIKFNFDSTTGKYYINTYCSLTELSAQITANNYTGDPYFFVYDGDTSSKVFHPASANASLTSSVTSATISSTSTTYNVRFNQTSVRTPVTLWFDARTSTISYTAPDFYTVSFGSTSNGSFKVNNNSSSFEVAEGSTMTVTPSPATHYEVNTVKYNDGSDHTVSLSGGEYTFTMPAHNVTVTVTFKKKNFSFTTAMSPSGAGATVTPANGEVESGDSASLTASDNLGTASGYKFKNWTTSTGYFTSWGGSTSSTNSTVLFFPNQSNAVATANYTQVRKITLPSVDHADVTASYTNYTDTSGQTLSEGNSAWVKTGTAVTLSITNIDYGYKVGTVQANSTTLTASSYSYTVAAGNTAVAYSISIVEDTSTPWKMVVSNQASTSGGTSNSYDFTKNSGETTQKVGYKTLSLTGGTNYYIKVYTGSTYYRTDGVDIDDSENPFSFNKTSDGNNVKLHATATGDYVFKIDFSGSTPTVTVYFPRPTITYNALSNGTYGDGKPMEAKSESTVTFKVKPNNTYYVSGLTVTYGSGSTVTTKSISTTVDASGYVTCTFTMPATNATVSVTLSQISITATPNSATAGKVTDIQNSSGTSVSPSVNNSTGVATCTGKFKIGDTYKLVVDANSNGLYCLNQDSSDISGTNVSYNSISKSTNRYVYTCTVLNGSVSANILFRATKPTISAPATKNMIVGTSFSIEDVVNSISNFTSVKYKWSTDSNYTTIAYSSKSIAAPNTYQTKTIQIQATNTRSDISDTTRKTADSTVTSISLVFDFAHSKVNVYIDTHGMNISNLKVGIYSDNNGSIGSIIARSGNNGNYEYNLSQQDGSDEKGNLYDSSNNRIKSNVWATGEENVPNISSAYIWLKISSTSPALEKNIRISAGELPTAGSDDVKDIWLEIVKNDEMKSQIKTTAPQSQVVADNRVRMYFMVPSGWNDWSSLYYYSWNDQWTDTWSNSNACTKLGKDSSGNTYYYADIKDDTQMIILKKSADADSESDTTKHENYAIGIKGSDGTYKYEHNYFKLANDSSTGKPIIQWVGEDVVVPKITKYTNLIAANTTDTRVYDITPTYKSEDGMSVAYVSEAPSYVSVSNGVVTPLKDTYSNNTYNTNGVKITVTLKSKIDNLVTTDRANYDRQTVYSYVKVNDPDRYDGIGLMSYESQTSKVLINPVTIGQNVSDASPEYPAYFNNVKTITSGTATRLTYNYGGSVIDLDANKHVATIKYAKSSNLIYTFQNSETFNYNNISVTGQADAQEAYEDESTHNRYGFYNQWFSTNTTPTLPSAFRTIFAGTPSSTDRNYTFTINNGTNYIMRFEPYEYTDVAVTFWYYQYDPRATVDGTTTYKYYYDSDKRNIAQAGLDNSTTPTTLKARDNHNIKHFTSVYEVRYWNSGGTRITPSTTSAALSTYVDQSARNVADNYYSYSYTSSDIFNSGWAVESGTQNQHRLNVFVWMHDEPREYNFQYTNENGTTSTLKTNCHYQEYVEAFAAGDSSVKWYDTRNTGSTADDILLATSPSYRFRISGDTYLRAVAMTTGEKELSDGPNSTVTYCNNEYESVAVSSNGTTTYIEYLFQNFFINDYFNASMVTYTPKTPHYDNYGDIDYYVDGDPTPYDDITFVGAGVFYYSVDNDGVPIKDAITREDYADSDSPYDTNIETVGDRLFELIKSANSSKVPTGLIDEEYLQSVFSYEIKETVDEVSGEKTGLVYRYLPAYSFTYSTENEGTEDEYKTISTRTFDDKVYRYSSMLGAYQYIYPVKVKNNSDNSNKNIKLHSYYIYRYTDYEHDEDYNEVYKIVISDSAAIAPTYMVLTQNE